MSDFNTVALLHFNAGNNSTNLDDFGSPKTWTASGTTKCTETIAPKFGRSCLLLDGISGYIGTPDHNDWSLSNVAWSFDFWLQFPGLPDSTPQCIFSKYQDSSNKYYLEVYGSSGNLTMRFRSYESGVLYNNYTFALPTGGVAIGTWYHFELSHNAGNIYLFLNGVLVATYSGVTTIANMTGNFEIGRCSAASFLYAAMDEFRASVGVARHTADFTPATSAYRRGGVDDEYTAFLSHCTGMNGTSPLADSTGLTITPAAPAKNTFTTSKYKFPVSSLYVNKDYCNIFTGNIGTTRTSILHRSLGTIDFWVKFIDFSQLHTFFVWAHNGVFWSLCYNQTSSPTHRFELLGTILSLEDDLAADTWYHIAFVKNDTEFSVYIDGVHVGTKTCTIPTAHDTQAKAAVAECYLFGGGGGTSYAYYDEYRVSIDIARWTTNFTPDAFEYGSNRYSETINDAMLFDDGLTITRNGAGWLFAETASSDMSLEETPVSYFLRAESIDETIDIIDNYIIGWQVANNEELALVDLAIAVRHILRQISDSFFIYDTCKQGWKISTESSLTLTDTIQTILGIIINDWLTLTDSQTNGWNGREIVSDHVTLYDIASGGKRFANTITESILLTDANLYKLTVTVLEHMGFSDLANAARSARASVSDSMTLADSSTPALRLLIADILDVVDAVSIIARVIHIINESIVLAEAASLIKRLGVTAADHLVFTDTLSSKAHLYNVAYDTLAMNVTVELDGEVWECYVLNTPSFHPSMYSGFNFNSYAVFENRAFGANDTGIYELTGDTDAGAKIHTGAILSQTYFGAPNQKRFRHGYLGISGTSPVMVFECEDGARQAYNIDATGHVVASSELKSKKWKLSIADFEQLDTIKLLPIILTK